MNIQLSKDLENFIHESVAAGRYATEGDVVEDALTRLRVQTPSPEPGMESLRVSVEEMRAGKGIPAEEVLAEMRQILDEAKQKTSR